MKNYIFATFLSLILSSLSLADEACPNPENNFAQRLTEAALPKVKETIYFSGIMTPAQIDELIERINSEVLKNRGNNLNLTINLDSDGGQVNATLKVVNLINELNKKPNISINTKVLPESSCSSICVVLFASGKKRISGRDSQFGFHRPTYQAGQVDGMTAEEIEQWFANLILKHITAVDPVSAATIKNKGYLDHKEISLMKGKDLRTGLVTEIGF